MIELTGGFQGVTIPLRELVAEIAARGWEPNVKLQGREYVAEGKNPHGESLEGTGPTDATAASNLLLKIMRRETIRGGSRASNFRLSSWNLDDLHNRLEGMAHEYAQAPVYDPKAASYWKELGDDSNMRGDVLRQQLKVEHTPEPEPYKTAQDMLDDIHHNQHFWVSTANTEHPIWDQRTNTNFRIVHDVLGHGVSGGNFDWPGEIAACQAHFPLLSEGAQKALAQECIGQTAAAAYYRSFMPQKVAVPSWIEELQARENPAGHTGVHPSQSLAPTTAPQVQPFQQNGLWWNTQVPHEDFQGGLPVFGSTISPRDPNALWQPDVQPVEPNAYLQSGDPLQAQAVKDNAMNIDTGWAKFNNPKTGEPDMDSIKQTVMNAFRAVLLSPRKDLKWNAIHYQDISSIPSTVTDPARYWDQLESRRVAWNTSRGFHPDSHKPYFKELGEFRKFMAVQHNDLDPIQAQDKADSEFMAMWNEEEDRIESDPANSELSSNEVERKIAAVMKKRLKEITNPSRPADDYGHEQLHLGGQLDLEGQEAGKYGAFMGTHLRQISSLSEHIDEIAKAALEDVQEHDATGHHFRSQVLQLNIPGVGPKVASFAWLLLQPGTSQLATIDTHMMDVLGHNYEKEMNDRDYFKFERELAAGRDAAGYQQVPLGQFQWGMWDYKRTGPGSHQDHSALKPVAPTPYDQIDWAQKMPMQQDWQEPDWWAATQPARQQVGDQWDADIASNFTQNEIPRTAKRRKIAMSTRIPYIQQGAKILTGQPGETFMNLARRELGGGPEEVWGQEGLTMGSYDPEQDRLFNQQGRLDPWQEQRIRQQLGV